MIHFILQLPNIYPQSKTKLPQNRAQEFNTPFTFQEPENVPPGRYTLTQITECIADHFKDKQIYTSQVLADRVKIDKKLMGVYNVIFKSLVRKLDIVNNKNP